MHRSPATRSSGSRALRGAALLAAVAVALVGCSSGTAAPSPSATSTSSVDVAQDLVFAKPGGTELRLDACTPKAPKGDLPAVVLVHSGEWSVGSHDDLTWLCEEGAQRGFAAFTIDYRLLPNAFPTQLEDVVSAVDWIGAEPQRERFHVDPERVALIGTSAGGAIVSQLLTGVPGSPVPSSRFIGGAVLSGIHDFTALATAATTDDERRVTLAYAGCDALDCARLGEISPVQHVDAGDPPMFLANSTTELIPLDQATAMDAALKAAGVRHELRVVDGEDHAEFIAKNHPDADAAMWTFLGSLAA